MAKQKNYTAATVRVYHGYGHKDNLIIYGHVLAGKSAKRSRYNHVISNMIYLAKAFLIKPIPGVKVQMQWRNQQLYSTTEADGFFKFEWASATEVAAGWHLVLVHLLNDNENIAATGEGKFFVPHSTQYAFISDIDDTILISYTSTIAKRLGELFTKNPRSRKVFIDAVKHYRLLSLAHTEPALLNPFFYVSNSEWNLYDYLNDFFKHNGLPKGVFLLNKIKRWYEVFKTGKTKHHDKLVRVERILEAFPKQRFVLLGDNSQSDPEIYISIANKYPDKIAAIYIRNISIKKELSTTKLLATIQNKKIYTCLFKHTDEAILYSKSIGLIDIL